jgi:thymidine kinase
MFSGKSEELIRRIRRAEIARQPVQLFKPRMDTRFAADHVVSHSDMRMPSECVASAREILERVREGTEVVGIDEGQFFDAGIVEVVNALADRGVRVIVAGLDQDYLGRPFEPMPQIIAIAEYVDKTLAICMRCGAPANRTQRLGGETDRVVVGGAEEYEARCRRCFHPGGLRSET